MDGFLAGMGPCMDGPPWALGMGQPWAGMGPRHEWALGMEGPLWALGMDVPWAGMGG